MSKYYIKFKTVGVSIFSILLLFSCNTRYKKVNKDIFKITLVAKVVEDDKFQVFYIDKINKGYTDDKRIVANVKQSIDFQEITFQLNTIPLTFRIDLGENGHISLVEIDKVILNNGNKKIELDSNVLHRFFEANIYTSKVGSVYHRSTVEGRYDPFISATALLEKKLELEFK
jgi:hypothetical protein